MEGDGERAEILIPPSLPPDKTPNLLKYWYLGSRARRYISRRRLEAVTECLGAACGGRVLDVGCGSGLALALLSRRGFRSFGIDLTDYGFYAARHIGEANDLEFALVKADVSRLPFRPSAFDAVTAVEMIEHVFDEDRSRAFAEIARAISPGGVLALSTPNYYSLVEIGKRLWYKSRSLRRLLPPMHYPTPDVPRESYHPHTYHLPLPVRRLRKLAEDAGLTVVATRKFLFVLKYTPDILLGIMQRVEKLLERLPLIRELACTVLIIAVKAR
jgi:2-polyprenyl-3-methyl-5-hydroxy-6-metoxy-1,4-benzoquinol methylase